MDLVENTGSAVDDTFEVVTEMEIWPTIVQRLKQLIKNSLLNRSKTLTDNLFFKSFSRVEHSKILTNISMKIFYEMQFYVKIGSLN